MAIRPAVPEGSVLTIIAAGWPELPVPDGEPGETQRLVGRITPTDRRPCLRGAIEIAGTAPADSATPGELILDGLLIDGAITVTAGGSANLGRLRISHASQVPGAGGLSVAGGHARLLIECERAMLGPIAVAATVPRLAVRDSIIDGHGGTAIDAIGAESVLDSVTVLGGTHVRALDASNTIFADTLTVERTQVGCTRFCYVPDGSRSPRLYRCQPAEALRKGDDATPDAVRARVKPIFTSLAFGDIAYAQLASAIAPEIKTGAEDGSEMGAYRFLMEPQRAANLQTAIAEYLRFGLAAGLIRVT
jgi:hypothetical protein